MKKSIKHIITKQGFTLAEVLIAIAIVVVLAAISIPIFTSQLRSTRRQTDIDNFNSACHSAIAAYYSNPSNSRTGTLTYIYDASTGMVQNINNGELIIPEGYGVSTSSDWNGLLYNMGTNYPCTNDGNARFVIIQFNNGDMTAWWDSNPNSSSEESSPSTTGAPIVSLELTEES